jgi:DNA-binding SARP family transcriptional activator
MGAEDILTETESKQLKVFTLGHFVVIDGDKFLSETRGRSRKVWDLFKYLLVNQDRVLLPDVIVEQLWPNQPYDNAKSAVRTLIHRLRSLLGEGVDLIRFTQGGYIFNRHQDLWVDVNVFESCCRQARLAAKQGLIQEAMNLYRQGLSLYKGDLLPECPYSDWLIPLRSHYRRLYLQSVVELALLLRESHAYAEIVEEITRALLIDYFEEELHLILLEALLDDGKVAQSKWHYENVTSVFYREMGLKPSPAMKRMLRLIQERDSDSGKVLDFSAFREAMQSRQQTNEAFFWSRNFLMLSATWKFVERKETVGKDCWPCWLQLPQNLALKQPEHGRRTWLLCRRFCRTPCAKAMCFAALASSSLWFCCRTLPWSRDSVFCSVWPPASKTVSCC